MVPAAVRRTLVSILVLVGSGLWVAALLIMAQTVQQSAHFSDLHPFIVGVNVAGLLVLLILIGGRVVQLIRDWRKRVVGSRLEARMVWMSATLAMLPLLLVFYFSVMFLNRGIDSWFHVEIREGLQDALTLSRAALDLRMREYMQRTRTIASDIASRDDPVALLDDARQKNEAIELTLYGANRRILGTSSERFGQIVPPRANEEMVMQTRHEYVTLDPVAGGGFLVRTAVQVPLTSPGDEPRMLEAVYPVERRLGELADTVESAYQRYGEKARLREPLKTSFTLTLTLVLLLSLFGALYGAFWAARRLVRPIQDLVAGTRAVAKGDFDMRLPLTSHDEMGILVHSFNDMTKRLARAREDNRRSQHAVEAERANLAVILARLSTGVISLEPDRTVRTANQAACNILGADVENVIGKPLVEAGKGSSLFEQFDLACSAHLDAGQTEWREQLVLQSESGRRILMCACTTLSGEDRSPGGFVIVFDDITALLQAQRDAAWGEVARRLAHEIKNPLTPIQLSAERLKRHFVDAPEPTRRLVDECARAIIAEVESLKSLVDEFSQFARMPAPKAVPTDLNALLADALALYAGLLTHATIELTAAPDLPPVRLDPEQVRRVVINLVDNAIEALSEARETGRMSKDAAGVIAIDTAHLPAHGVVRLRVADNGPGLPEGDRSKLFMPYYSTKGRGSGLGLAIVRRIIAEHGGSIEAADNTPHGTCFTIELPV